MFTERLIGSQVTTAANERHNDGAAIQLIRIQFDNWRIE